jgi:hypothetical protein
MAKVSKPKPRIIYRDAETGKLVTKEYADKNPKTTTKESVKP